MARWIDMTDAQRGALTMKLQAKERAQVLANPSKIIKALAQIDAEASEILAEGGRFAEQQAARWLEEKQPIFARLARLNINPADIGVAV